MTRCRFLLEAADLGVDGERCVDLLLFRVFELQSSELLKIVFAHPISSVPTLLGDTIELRDERSLQLRESLVIRNTIRVRGAVLLRPLARRRSISASFS